MHKFYIKNLINNTAYRSLMPTCEIDCPPLDFYKYSHAENLFEICNENLKYTCSIQIPECVVRDFVLSKVEEQIYTMLSSTTLKPVIYDLLSDDSLTFKKQEKLLNGMIFYASDILWLNQCAQDLGYLLDVYQEQKYDIKFDEKQKPLVIEQKEDNNIEYTGKTNMSKGEMRALLKQRKVIQARIYHRNLHWHCFYFTYKFHFTPSYIH